MTTKPILLALLLLAGWTLSAQPANDDPCDAITLDVFSSCTPSTHTNVAATNTSGVLSPGCAGYSGGDVWFSFTMPNNGYHVILETTMGTMLNGGMAVYSGACGSLSPILCDDMGDGQLSLRVEDGCNYVDAGSTFWVRVWDDGNANNGTFDICAYAMYPAVPAGAVGCATFVPPGNSCCDATILSDGLDGYCGSTNGYTDEPAAIPEFCAFLDNNSWVAFVAGSEQVVLEITSSNCVFGNGIQVAILETTDCTNFVMKSNCWNPGPGGASTGLVTGTDLIPGEIYYLMVDGWGGDICDYTIRVIEGIQTTNVTVSDDSICAGQSVQLMAEIIGVGPFSFAWSPAGSLDDPTSQNPIASPLTPTDYTVTITGATDPIHTVSVHVDTAPPAEPSVNGPAVVCEFQSGVEYSAGMPGGNIYSWSLTAGGSIIGSMTDSIVTVDWGMSGGILCLTVYNECGASTPGCLVVNTIPRPDISAADPMPLCHPNTIDLTSIVITNASFGGGPVSYYADEASAIAGTPTLPSTLVSTGGIYWIRMDSGPNCFDHTSVNVAIQDPDIFVNPPAATCMPNTVNLSSLLINELNSVGPPSALSYYTDSLEAVNELNAIPSPVVSTGGVYWVRYETSGGCFDVGPVNVDIFPLADISLDYTPTICANESIDLDTMSFTDANTTTIVSKYFYTSFSLASTGLTALAMSNTIVSDAGPYFMRVDTDNGCPTILEINISIRSLPEASLSATSSVCTGSSANLVFNLVGTPPYTIVYSDGTNNITLSNILSTPHTESVVINSTTTFSLVSIQDASVCSGILNTGPVMVTANPLPTATLSGDAVICNGDAATLTFNFTGNGPFDVVYNNGMMDISLNGMVDGDQLSANPTTSNTYTLISVVDNLGCIGTVSGTALITVNEPFQILNVLETCNPQYLGYTVSFEITGGDPSSYVVTGGTGTLTGNQFVSDEIVAGGAYNFTISDAGACPSVSISGSQDCLCGNDAGTMDPALVEVCEGGTATAPATTGTVFEPGHFLQYVLHDNAGASLGTIFATSNTPSFVLQAGMSLNTTYYISPIVGPDNGMGNVDITHTCFTLAAGTPILFVETPEAMISGSTDICNGNSATLTIHILGGIPPFDVTYSDGSLPVTLDDIVDGFTFSVSPTINTSYSIVSIVDNTGANCGGTASGSAIINVWDAPMASPVAYECDAFNSSFRVSFTISGGNSASYTVGGDAGNLDNVTQLFTSDWYPNGSTYNFQIDDANNCGPTIVTGTYECPCTSFSGTMDVTLKEACEGETVSFDHGGDQILDGNDVLGFVLHDGGATTPGAIMMTSLTPVFTYAPPLVIGQTYYVSAIVADDNGLGFPVTDSALDRCLSISDGQPVRFDPITEAWLSGAVTICEGETTTLVFNFADPGTYDVVWSDGTENFTEIGISHGSTVEVRPLTTTTYTLISSVSSNTSRCASTIDPATSQITINVTDVPEVQNVLIDCDNMGTSFAISFEIVGGDAANYAVAGNSGQLVGNVFTSDRMLSGSTYVFDITDGSGCPPVTLTATEYCNCTPDIEAAISVEEGISCPGSSDGLLSVSNVNGEAPFEFAWSTGEDGLEIANLATGWYRVTMTDGNQCTREDSIFLTQPDSIQANLETLETSCFEEDDGQINITDITGGTAPYNFGLENMVTNYTDQTFYNLEAGEYTVIISDANACSWSQPVEVIQPEELVVDLGEDLTLQLGDSVELVAFTNLPVDSIRWTPDEFTECRNCVTQMVKPLSSSIYTIDVINSAGCRSSDQIRVFIDKEPDLYIPNAFSPNGDGTNDFFTIYAGQGVEKVHQLQIFSRWGELMFSTNELVPGDEEMGWNGRLNGRLMLTGTYTYFTEVEFIDGRVELFTGTVNLVR